MCSTAWIKPPLFPVGASLLAMLLTLIASKLAPTKKQIRY
jgi:hypothetical protein